MSNYQVSDDFLLDHAYKKVWCTPEQDKQAILQLARVTPPNGVWTYFNFQTRKIQLPQTGSDARFHVYQIGQVHPSILGLLNKPNQWVPATVAMQQECALLDVYNGKGIMIPRSLCWYIVTGDKNLLVAIRKPSERPSKIVDVDLESEPVFLRLYSNAYFNSVRANMPQGCVLAKSIKSDSITSITNFQSEIAALPSYGGKLFYVNGRRVNQINLISASPGDYIEYVFDGSIKREVRFKVRLLEEFESDLDDLHKYVLHYPGEVNMIDYQDDIDVYLISPNADTIRWQGAYIHKNDSRTLRMITHRDYSIPVIRVDGTQAANPFLVTGGVDVELLLTIRHSGYERPLVLEHHRIAELYKLSDEKVQGAMTGLDATVSVWTAESLENSAYTRIMRQKQGGVTKAMVQEAYGYNAMSKLLGDTPARVIPFSEQKIVVIPMGLIGCCTVYEYSEDGRLLFYANHVTDNTYTCQSADTAFVEVIYGLGGETLDVADQTLIGTIDLRHNYRFYAADGIGGVQTGDWADRSGEPYYLLNGNTYTWVASAAPFNRVLSNKRHLAYSFNLAPNAGVFEFDITVFKNGAYRKLDIPLGELDIFFNGYSLIENLDYVVRGSRVVVTTKKYYNDTLAQQQFTVRYSGFCNKDMTRQPTGEVGFVFHGNLSANNRFDIRDDKVMRMVVGGGVRLKDELEFAEDGVEVSVPNVLNGAPYSIRDIIVPMNHYLIGGDAVDKTYEYRKASQLVDEEISDYLTLQLPENRTEFPNVIPERYTLYSPFLSRIISDILSGVLWDDRFEEHFGDDWLRTRLASYLPLLDFDPIGTGFEVDNRYVVIHPHPYHTYVTLNMYQWRVMQRVGKIFAPQVDLSNTINVLQF